MTPIPFLLVTWGTWSGLVDARHGCSDLHRGAGQECVRGRGPPRQTQWAQGRGGGQGGLGCSGDQSRQEADTAGTLCQCWGEGMKCLCCDNRIKLITNSVTLTCIYVVSLTTATTNIWSCTYVLVWYTVCLPLHWYSGIIPWTTMVIYFKYVVCVYIFYVQSLACIFYCDRTQPVVTTWN